MNLRSHDASESHGSESRPALDAGDECLFVTALHMKCWNYLRVFQYCVVSLFLYKSRVSLEGELEKHLFHNSDHGLLHYWKMVCIVTHFEKVHTDWTSHWETHFQ